MVTKEELETLINKIKDSVPDTEGALISNDLLAIKSTYENGINEFDKINLINTKLQKEKNELLMANGELFRKVGFDKKEEPKKEEMNNVIKIDDIINERGELI